MLKESSSAPASSGIRPESLLAAAYGDDKFDIAVVPTASPVALAMLPVAEEYKKILLVEPAVADSITGDKWNKYILCFPLQS